METFLFTHEEIIARTDEDTVVLTTHRVRFAPSKSQITSLMLDAIVGVQVRNSSRIVFAGLAMACLMAAVVGVMKQHGAGVAAAVALTVTFLFLYLGSRKQVLRIITAGLALEIHLVSMKYDEILNFINHIEMARESLTHKGVRAGVSSMLQA